MFDDCIVFRDECWIVIQDGHDHGSPNTLKVLFTIATGRVRQECRNQEGCFLCENWMKIPYCILVKSCLCCTALATPAVPAFILQQNMFMYRSQPETYGASKFMNAITMPWPRISFAMMSRGLLEKLFERRSRSSTAGLRLLNTIVGDPAASRYMISPTATLLEH